MKNPSEEMVTAWLQECMGYFTMNNIKVPKVGVRKLKQYRLDAARGYMNIFETFHERD